MTAPEPSIQGPPWLSRFGRNVPVLELLAQAAENGLEDADAYLLDDLCLMAESRADGAVALLLAAILALREGSVCLELSQSEVARRLEGLAAPEEVERLARAAMQELEKGALNALFPDEKAGQPVAPLILKAVGVRKLLYFQKYLRHEERLQTLLRGRLSLPPAASEQTALKAVLQQVRLASAENGQRLNDDQYAACAMAMLQQTLIITGGPGTGKTSVVVAALACHLRRGVKPAEIGLACPTGRAAQRLTEALRQRLPSLAGESPAQALAELEAKTLHRLLSYSSATGSFWHHRENPLPYSVVILDETSMLDVVLMARLLDALRPNTRLILLGDKDQLPSVDAGSVLADLIPSSGPAYTESFAKNIEALTGVKLKAQSKPGLLCDKVAVLRVNHRSQRHIQETAAAVIGCHANNADEVIDALPRPGSVRPAASARLKKSRDAANQMFLFADPPQENLSPAPAASSGGAASLARGTLTRKGDDRDGGCWFMPATPAQLSEALKGWVKRAYQDTGYIDLARKARAPKVGAAIADPAIQRVFDLVHAARILTLVREGPCGCNSINEAIVDLLRPGRKRTQIFTGAPLLFTANDYSRMLFNGDVGVCLRDDENASRVVFERRGEKGQRQYISFAAETLYGCELAFAMTVHKAQGSEFDEVFLALPSEGGERLLNRQMIYTGITRAKSLALICGAQPVLKQALSRGVERCSGLTL
ncbi:MAG TPA: AAA family ATPase [Planctomycetota bacterium]|nr:AAA family ATPase [Planctomycetota bacterium]